MMVPETGTGEISVGPVKEKFGPRRFGEGGQGSSPSRLGPNLVADAPILFRHLRITHLADLP